MPVGKRECAGDKFQSLTEKVLASLWEDSHGQSDVFILGPVSQGWEAQSEVQFSLRGQGQTPFITQGSHACIPNKQRFGRGSGELHPSGDCPMVLETSLHFLRYTSFMRKEHH